MTDRRELDARVNQLATALRSDVREVAAVAAYTRDDVEPERQIPFEQRRQDRQDYWREVAARAVTAALNRLVCPACDSIRTEPAPAKDIEAGDAQPGQMDCLQCGHVWKVIEL